jgi:hypothetical protein
MKKSLLITLLFLGISISFVAQNSTEIDDDLIMFNENGILIHFLDTKKLTCERTYIKIIFEKESKESIMASLSGGTLSQEQEDDTWSLKINCTANDIILRIIETDAEHNRKVLAEVPLDKERAVPNTK